MKVDGFALSVACSSCLANLHDTEQAQSIETGRAFWSTQSFHAVTILHIYLLSMSSANTVGHVLGIGKVS